MNPIHDGFLKCSKTAALRRNLHFGWGCCDWCFSNRGASEIRSNSASHRIESAVKSAVLISAPPPARHPTQHNALFHRLPAPHRTALHPSPFSSLLPTNHGCGVCSPPADCRAASFCASSSPHRPDMFPHSTPILAVPSRLSNPSPHHRSRASHSSPHSPCRCPTPTNNCRPPIHTRSTTTTCPGRTPDTQEAALVLRTAPRIRRIGIRYPQTTPLLPRVSVSRPLNYRTVPHYCSLLRNDHALPPPPASATVRLRTPSNAAIPLLTVFPYIPPPPPIVGDAPPVDTYAPPPALATLKANDQTYLFRTMHFHVSSEHIVNAMPAPLEMHLVFEKRQGVPLPTPVQSPPPPPPPPPPAAATSSSSIPPPGVPPAQAEEEKPDVPTEPSTKPPPAPNTVVVAVLGQPAAQSAPWLSSVVEIVKTTSEEGRARGVVHELNMEEVLPSFDSTALYQYMGSLTTPPCTEGIQWIVVSDRMDVSESDCEAIATWQRGKNARPIQETNGRQVIRYPPVNVDGPN